MADYFPVERKSYSRFKKIDLPKPETFSASFYDLLHKRNSWGIGSENALDARILSSILYYSAGEQKRIYNGEVLESIKKFYPSGGGLYPLEHYIVVLDQIHFGDSFLVKGIYYYDQKNHSLIFLWTLEEVGQSYLEVEDKFNKQKVILVTTSMIERTAKKYGIDLATKFSLIECGAFSQNVSLLSQVYGIKCTLVNKGVEKFAKTLDLDENKETPLLLIVLNFFYEKKGN